MIAFQSLLLMMSQILSLMTPQILSLMTPRISASVFLPVVTADNAARSISLDTVELGVKQTSLPYGADGLDQNPCCREADLQGKNKKESDMKNIIVPKPPSIIRTKNIGVKRMRKAVSFKNIVDGQYFDEADGTWLDNTDDFVDVLKAPQKEKWQVPKESILDNLIALMAQIDAD